jgi:hypothetical protein
MPSWTTAVAALLAFAAFRYSHLLVPSLVVLAPCEVGTDHLCAQLTDRTGHVTESVPCTWIDYELFQTVMPCVSPSRDKHLARNCFNTPPSGGQLRRLTAAADVYADDNGTEYQAAGFLGGLLRDRPFSSVTLLAADPVHGGTLEFRAPATALAADGSLPTEALRNGAYNFFDPRKGACARAYDAAVGHTSFTFALSRSPLTECLRAGLRGAVCHFWADLLPVALHRARHSWGPLTATANTDA